MECVLKRYVEVAPPRSRDGSRDLRGPARGASRVVRVTMIRMNITYRGETGILQGSDIVTRSTMRTKNTRRVQKDPLPIPTGAVLLLTTV